MKFGMFGMIQMYWEGLLEHEWAFSCTATGDITDDVVQRMQKIVQKINRNFGVEALRLDASKKCNALMTQEAKEKSQLKVFVPDETLLTRKMMEALFNKSNEMLDALMHVREAHFIHRLYMQLSDGKGGYEYYGVANAEERGKVNFIRIDPCFDGEFLDDCILTSIDFPLRLSEAAQQDIQKIADSFNTKIGFKAFDCISASFWEDDWLRSHELKLSQLTVQLSSTSLSEEERAALEVERQQEEHEEFDPADLILFAAVNCKRIYTFAQLKLVCKTMQEIYDRIRQELDEEEIVFKSQRIQLEDRHTWVKITLEDGEIVWRDEYCPYEGLLAQAIEHFCYADYENHVELDEKMTEIPKYIWKQDENAYAPVVCRIRALRFIDLVRDYFDQEIDFSIESLSTVALFLNAVRDSLTPDRENLRPDASTRMERMFKELLKREDEDGALKLRNYANVLYQNIMKPLSAYLGEIYRIHCANFVWKPKIEKQEDGTSVLEYILCETKRKLQFFQIAFAEKFFYEKGYELNIDDYYYESVKQFKFEPAVTHEYRFKHLPENNQPDNILPFRTR